MICTLLIVVLFGAIAVGCSFAGGDAVTQTPTQTTTQTPKQTAIQIDKELKDRKAVMDYATDYVRQKAEYYSKIGASSTDGSKAYKITDSKIIGLTQIGNGAAGNFRSINMYLLQYRLKPDNPDNVVLVGGMTLEDGWITEWGSTGQPYLLLLCEHKDGEEASWHRICVTNTDAINVDYGTPEMLKKYGDKYTAAAMELYGKYKETSKAIPLTLEEIERFREAFAPLIFDAEGRRKASPISCFFTSFYDKPADLDLAKFLRYFPNGSIVTDEAEFNAVKNLDNSPFKGHDKVPVPMHKYPSEELDKVLVEYAGITHKDLSGVGLDDVFYLEAYDAYYNYTSDFGPGTFYCVRGETEGDTVRLFADHGNGSKTKLTLRKQDGRYIIMSYQKIDG